MTTSNQSEVSAEVAGKSHDYCVVYRMGGTENFEWLRTLPMSSQAAYSAKEAIERGGRRAMVVRYSQSVSIGLPETYDGTTNPAHPSRD